MGLIIKQESFTAGIKKATELWFVQHKKMMYPEQKYTPEIEFGIRLTERKKCCRIYEKKLSELFRDV